MRARIRPMLPEASCVRRSLRSMRFNISRNDHSVSRPLCWPSADVDCVRSAVRRDGSAIGAAAAAAAARGAGLRAAGLRAAGFFALVFDVALEAVERRAAGFFATAFFGADFLGAGFLDDDGPVDFALGVRFRPAPPPDGLRLLIRFPPDPTRFSVALTRQSSRSTISSRARPTTSVGFGPWGGARCVHVASPRPSAHSSSASSSSC